MKASGDIRKRISRGERARGPVIMRFVTTVFSNILVLSGGREKGGKLTLTAANMTPSKVRMNPIIVK